MQVGPNLLPHNSQTHPSPFQVGVQLTSAAQILLFRLLNLPCRFQVWFPHPLVSPSPHQKAPL